VRGERKNSEASHYLVDDEDIPRDVLVNYSEEWNNAFWDEQRIISINGAEIDMGAKHYFEGYSCRSSYIAVSR
jgi:hypothetical protein